jgi:hypothetical protein
MQKIIKYTKLILVLIIAFQFFKICSNNYNADKMYEKAKDAVDKVDLSNAFKYSETAIKLNPLEPNYYRMRARVLINYLPYKDKSVRTFTKQLIVRDLENAYNLNPENLVTIRNIVPLYYFVAVENVSSPAGPANVDPYFVDPAKNFFMLAKNYSKNDVGVYALVAKYEKRLNLMEEYNDSVEKVRDLRPDLLDWYDSFK